MKMFILIALLFSFPLYSFEQHDCFKGNLQGVEKAQAVVLIPGAGLRGENLHLGGVNTGAYFRQVTKHFEQRQIPFFTVKGREDGNGSVQDRLDRSVNLILSLKDKYKKILVIGHSMGGIAARLALRYPEVRELISAVIQFSAPNRGTPVADFIIDPDPGIGKKALKQIASLIGYDVDDKRYIKELSLNSAYLWDQAIDHHWANPPILSVANWKSSSAALALGNPAFGISSNWACKELKKRGEPCEVNDGLVTRSSQIWNQCFLEVEADHGEIIGVSVNPARVKKFHQFFDSFLDLLKNDGLI